MRYFILTLLLSFTFSECDQFNQLQCNSNPECEWIEDTYTGNCSNLNGVTACEAAGCNWECGFSHGSCYWCCWYECGGGSYEIDNSYCQENPDFIQGDLNGDLILNVLDVIIIVDIILNQESSDLADINGDGIVNILDVIELVDIIINT